MPTPDASAFINQQKLNAIAKDTLSNGNNKVKSFSYSYINIPLVIAIQNFLPSIKKNDIKKILFEVIAGTGISGYSGDGGLATSAQLNFVRVVTVDTTGNIFIADTDNDRIRKIDARTGIITTIAGTGIRGYSGDGGLATSAQINEPRGITVDSSGNIIISDTFNHRIRKIDARTGIITTIAGTGISGYSGDGGLATSAQLNYVRGAAIDSSGNIIISDTFNHRIRKIDARTGIITTIAGTDIRGYSGDGGLATSAQLNLPSAITLDSSRNILFVDFDNNRIRKIDARTGIITTIAGTGISGYSGDGGLATSARLNFPRGIAVHSSGNIIISDTGNARIRKIDARTGIITTIKSSDGTEVISFPQTISVDSLGRIIVPAASVFKVYRITNI